MRAGAVLRGAGSSVAASQIRFPRSDCRSASPASHERGGAAVGGGGVALLLAASCVLKSRAVIELFRFTSGTSVSLWRSRMKYGRMEKSRETEVAAQCVRAYWAARRCVSLAMSHVRLTPAVCRKSAKQGRLAKCRVSIPRGSRSPLARSQIPVRLSNSAGSLQVCAFPYGDPDGETRERGENGVGGAAQLRFAQSHWLCHAFRGEYAGAEMWKPHCGRPRLRQGDQSPWTLFI